MIDITPLDIRNNITNFCVLLVISSLKMKLKFSYYQKYQNIRLLNRDGAPPTVSKSNWGGGGGVLENEPKNEVKIQNFPYKMSVKPKNFRPRQATLVKQDQLISNIQKFKLER